MKFLANVTKGGKELFKTLFLLILILVFSQFIVYLLYAFAYQSHLPLTNFDLFMRFCFFLMSMLLFTCFLVSATKMNSARSLIILFALFIVCTFSAAYFNWNLSVFERIFWFVFSLFIGSVVGLLVSTIGYRIVSNALFRKLFTEEFQERCEVYPKQNSFFLSVNWIRKVVFFYIRHLKNNETVFYIPLDSLDCAAEFEKESPVAKAFIEEPATIQNLCGYVEVRFRFNLCQT